MTLVVQAGLPPDSDAYTHRVGRTARAGKDGRAVILLTQDESFFIDVNRQFPITSHSASDDILKDPDSRTTVSHAFQSIDQDTKQKAYSSYLGVMKGFMNKLRIKPEGLVRIANELALEGMNCQELPEMTRKTIGYVINILVYCSRLHSMQVGR